MEAKSQINDSVALKIDSSQVSIHRLTGDNLKELFICDQVFYESFTTLLKHKKFPTNLASRRRYCDQIYIAEYKNKIIGCVIAVNCGNHRILGPLSVLPKYWQNGIASKLLSHLFNVSDNPKSTKITRDVLMTFTDKFHIKFYRKFGYKPRFLAYRTSTKIPITFKQDTETSKESKFILSRLMKNKNKYTFQSNMIDSYNDILDKCVELCDAEYKGLNPICIINGVLNNNDDIGQVLCLFCDEKDKMELVGFCICVYSDGSKNSIFIRFGIAKSQDILKILLVKVSDYCVKQNIVNISVRINTGRVQTFDLITNELGFDYDCTHPNVTMGKVTNSNSNDEDAFDSYNVYNSCILGGWS